MNDNPTALPKNIDRTPMRNLREIVDSIARSLLDLLGCDTVVLYIYDEEREQFVFPPTMMGLLRFPEKILRAGQIEEDSITYKIISLNDLYISENVVEDSLMSDNFIRREGIKSFIGIPLTANEQKVGVISISFRQPHHFTSTELELLKAFSSQAAIAISNAILWEQLRARTNTLQAISEASRAISASLDINKILLSITEQAYRLTSVRGSKALFSYLALIEDDSLIFKASFPQKHLPRLKNSILKVNLGNDRRIGTSGRAIVTGKSQLIGDVDNDADYIKYDLKTRSELAVPMIVEGKVIGVISVEHPEIYAFDKEDVRALELLAAQAAIAIQNAYQYEDLRQTKGLVGARTALAWMGMTGTIWRHAIENHAIIIREQVELLRHDLQKSVNVESLNKRLRLIERLADQIREEPMVPPLSSEEGVVSVSINEFLRERTKQLWEREPYKEIKIKLKLQATDIATVRVSPEWLQRALDIIVENAGNAVAKQQQSRITIGSKEIDDEIEIFVSDTGRGIPPDISQKLFAVPVAGTGKLGLGLLLAQTIVQAYGGNIQISSTGPKGTTMSIVLPKELTEFMKTGRTKLAMTSREGVIVGHEGEIRPVEIVRLYNELKDAYDELKELDRKKTEFLSTVSHELRTPLTSVQSCIENLLSGMYGFLNEKQHSRLDIALAGAREESRLIANLLDLARIQEGKSTLNLSSENISKVIHDVVGVFRYDAMQKGIILKEDYPSGESLDAIVDTGKIKQVTTNLISNALKFTPKGGSITISTQKSDNQIEIRVKDTGIGIPETEHTKIFDRFYQVDNSLTRKVGGTGIGLNIAKEYVEMHEGRIWVESKIGEGSTFIIILPINKTGSE